MPEEKKPPADSVHSSVQLERDIPFIELVREARKLEEMPQKENTKENFEIPTQAERVVTSNPSYSEMSFSEILSELRKIEKVKASLDYSMGVAVSPISQAEANKRTSQEALARTQSQAKPTAQPVGAKPSAVIAKKNAQEPSPQIPIPALQKKAQPIQAEQEKQAIKYTRADPIEAKPVEILAPARYTEKPTAANSPQDTQKKSALVIDELAREEIDSAKRERVEPKEKHELGSLANQIKQAMEQPTSEAKTAKKIPSGPLEEKKQRSRLIQMMADAPEPQPTQEPEPKKKQFEKPEREEAKPLAQQIATAKPAPKPEAKMPAQPEEKKPAYFQPITAKEEQKKEPERPSWLAPSDYSEPKSFNWPAGQQPKAQQQEPPPLKPALNIQRAPAPKEEAKAEKKGILSGLAGMLGRGGKKEESVSIQKEKPQANILPPRPSSTNVAEPPRAREPPPEPQLIMPEGARKAQDARARAPSFVPPTEPEPPEDEASMIEKIEETKKRIAAMRAQKALQAKEEIDTAQLDSLGKYKKEHSEPDEGEDPLARLREYRKRRKEELEGKSGSK
ncbi:MAG: hypothetical protein V1909_00370 [Candidatus Micrarchaeota archaeon]